MASAWDRFWSNVSEQPNGCWSATTTRWSVRWSWHKPVTWLREPASGARSLTTSGRASPCWRRSGRPCWGKTTMASNDVSRAAGERHPATGRSPGVGSWAARGRRGEDGRPRAGMLRFAASHSAAR